jgi:hypothetical protein
VCPSACYGEAYAPAWEELRGRPVEEVAQLVALNVLSEGSTLRSLSSKGGRAGMPVEGWPDEESLGFLPLERDECDRIWDTYGPSWSIWASATLGGVRTTW